MHHRHALTQERSMSKHAAADLYADRDYANIRSVITMAVITGSRASSLDGIVVHRHEGPTFRLGNHILVVAGAPGRYATHTVDSDAELDAAVAGEDYIWDDDEPYDPDEDYKRSLLYGEDI
ncbi:hypothetical protein PBI_SEBATA_148 [Mycobacterium phage Sebata]|uniref:Uncharacterized protein n=20 Tax=Bixzunavirus TaxID=680114 RepID=B5LJQ8_9CAUD|nr:gp142 [Mycobacterium phage Rizal]YP_003347814.1 hypothetical protein ET08_135 [Mycobacterium phage ET08]YP_009014734.1 hypothetical protein LINSTU_145 [Mycobacterium phage LinStu]YP_009216400.1 hypothetical protein ALICE_140 [Mycobacterium phage Alice]YP_009608828.1 hypothetical protein FDI20_gp171 [Mycobacterium phage Sebata]ACU41665.1 hypothetical protein LRRHOOD_141 [Mycobacterium phage LRRHood]AIX12822.1 hypothetical protein PBI_ZYGOTAIGA_145 [Mycobacterium phage ZygoTaiga]AKY02437.1 